MVLKTNHSSATSTPTPRNEIDIAVVMIAKLAVFAMPDAVCAEDNGIARRTRKVAQFFSKKGYLPRYLQVAGNSEGNSCSNNDDHGVTVTLAPS